MNNNPYEFEFGDKVCIVSAPGVRPSGHIVARYLSDKFNHPANPHIRYVIKLNGGQICDVCNQEVAADD